MKAVVELIYIGDEFYSRSGSSISPIYTLDGQRYDWGFVAIALQNGKSVHIRPATEAEKAPYYKKLVELQTW